MNNAKRRLVCQSTWYLPELSLPIGRCCRAALMSAPAAGHLDLPQHAWTQRDSAGPSLTIRPGHRSHASYSSPWSTPENPPRFTAIWRNLPQPPHSKGLTGFDQVGLSRTRFDRPTRFTTGRQPARRRFPSSSGAIYLQPPPPIVFPSGAAPSARPIPPLKGRIQSDWVRFPVSAFSISAFCSCPP